MTWMQRHQRYGQRHLECVGNPFWGCTDSLACNYNVEANTDDESCTSGEACDDMDDMTTNDMISDMCGGVGEPAVEGCMDEDAYKHAIANIATVHVYDDVWVCAGDCFGTSMKMAFVPMVVLGCTDSLACNFDMDANTDDGSCLVIGESCDDMDDMTLNDMVNICACVVS